MFEYLWSFIKNTTNFEAFCKTISSSINILFLKSCDAILFATYIQYSAPKLEKIVHLMICDVTRHHKKGLGIKVDKENGVSTTNYTFFPNFGAL